MHDEIAIEMLLLKPTMHLRYIVDIFILWFHQEYVQAFLGNVNSIRLQFLQFIQHQERLIIT